VKRHVPINAPKLTIEILSLGLIEVHATKSLNGLGRRSNLGNQMQKFAGGRAADQIAPSCLLRCAENFWLLVI
jgi:hypothetical protein